MAEKVTASLLVKIAANTADFSKGLKTANSQFEQFTKGLKQLGATIGVAFGIGQIKDFAGSVIDITAKFQKFEAVLTNTLGSRSAALGALEDIKSFAASTPFSVDELTASFVKLANQGFQPTIKELTSLGDLAASQGKSFDQLTEAIIDAQTGEFERLKEFGIRAKKEGDKVTFTFKGVKQQVDFTADSIRKYVLGLGTAVGVSGGMAAISETIGGKISNLGDNFDQLLTTIGNKSSGLISGFLDFANSALGSVNGALNDQVRTLQQENIELNGLVGAITDTNTSEEVRSKLLTELNRKYPDFLKNLNAETVTNEQLTNRLKDVNDQFQRKILLVAAEKELAKVSEQIISQVNREADARVRLQKILQGKGDAGPVTGLSFDTNQQQIAKQQLALEEIINNSVKERASLQGELNDRMKAYNEALGIFNTTGNDYFVQTTKATTATNAFSEALKKLKDSLKFKVKLSSDDVNNEHLFDDIQKSFENPDIKLGLSEAEFEKLNDEFFIPFTEAWEKAHGVVSDTTLDMSVKSEEMADRMKEAWRQTAESIGAALGEMATSQQNFVQALAGGIRAVVEALKRQALAAIIANAAKSGKNPIAAIALASFGFAAISSLFSRIGSSNLSSGGQTSSPRGTNDTTFESTRSQTLKLEVSPLVIRGQDLWGSLKAVEANSKYTSSSNG